MDHRACPGCGYIYYRDTDYLVRCIWCDSLLPEVVQMKTSAIIDETGQYRYSLVREWDAGLPRVVFVMLNGSTADAEKDDPTLRRCIGFAKAWGYGSLEVVNLFAYRTTFPKELKQADDPVGPENDKHILEAIYRAKTVFLAWGTHGKYQGRDNQVIGLLKKSGISTMWCLEKTKDGHPRHPLYVRGNVEPILLKMAVS